MSKRNMYIDYQHDLPGEIYTQPQTLLENLHDKSNYDIQAFSRKMVAPPQKSYTRDIVDFILQQKI